MSTQINTNYRLDTNTQTVAELWESVAKLAAGRVADNKLCDSYPINVRQAQLMSLKGLVQRLEQTHDAIENTLCVRNS